MAITIPVRKITEMTEKATLVANDLLTIVDSAESVPSLMNKKLKASVLKTFTNPTGTAPISVSAAGAISITKATSSANGYLDKNDFATFSNKETVQTVDNAPTSPLTIVANTCYKFGSAITSLTISNRVDSTEEIEIQFTVGASFSFTASAWSAYWLNGAPTFSANKSYVIAFKNGYGAWGEVA